MIKSLKILDLLTTTAQCFLFNQWDSGDCTKARLVRPQNSIFLSDRVSFVSDSMIFARQGGRINSFSSVQKNYMSQLPGNANSTRLKNKSACNFLSDRRCSGFQEEWIDYLHQLISWGQWFVRAWLPERWVVMWTDWHDLEYMKEHSRKMWMPYVHLRKKEQRNLENSLLPSAWIVHSTHTRRVLFSWTYCPPEFCRVPLRTWNYF